MTRLLLGLLSIGIAYLVYGFMVSTYEVNKGISKIGDNEPYPFFDYRGVTNVSSVRTLGSGEDREIIMDAKQADLDYLFITDLNLAERDTSADIYFGDLLVLRGSKYSYLDSRLIYYRPDGFPDVDSLGEMQVQLTDLLSQPKESRGDSFVVLAHPFLKGYEWTGEWPIGLDGLEVINFKRVQQQHLSESRLSSLWSLLIYPFNPELAFIRLFSEPLLETNLWDELGKTRIVAGHLGLEATAKAIPFTGSVLKFPSYETLFRLGSEHILLRSELTGNAKSDKIKILRALGKGEFYFSLDVLGNPKGFNIVLEDQDQLYLMGSSLSWKPKLNFRIELPSVNSPVEIHMVRDGELIRTFNSSQKNITVDRPGNYRFVVRLKVMLPLPDQTRWIPWIYTNQFRVL